MVEIHPPPHFHAATPARIPLNGPSITLLLFGYHSIFCLEEDLGNTGAIVALKRETRGTLVSTQQLAAKISPAPAQTSEGRDLDISSTHRSKMRTYQRPSLSRTTLELPGKYMSLGKQPECCLTVRRFL